MAPALIHPVGIPLTPTHDSNDVKTRRRSSTFTAITNWALAVQPGTPAPLSPVKRCRPSFHRRIASSSSSPSFLLTPTTAKSGNVDLTAWGYTSVFLHLPVTPQTPAAFYPPEPVVKSSGKVEKGLKKISSMGILRRNRAKSVTGDSTSPIAATSPVTNTPPTRPRPRSRSRSGSVSTAKPSLKRPGHVKSKSVSATVPNQTKAKKTKTKTKTHPPLPPALQNELMLMQFAGGGSLEANAHKFLEERSKRDGTTKAIDAVYRDENGVMWLDEDERVEYQALIPTEGLSSPPASPWVQFTSSGAVPPVCPTMGAIVMTDEDATRRPSVVSLSPTERELEGGAAAVVRPVSPSAYVGVGVGVELSLPSTGSSSPSCGERTERRRRRRPAPLKIHSTHSVPTISQLGFEDSFEPTSAAVAALAAGMHTHATRRVGVSRSVLASEVGSAPPDVVAFDTTTRVKGRKMNLAKKAKALFGIE